MTVHCLRISRPKKALCASFRANLVTVLSFAMLLYCRITTFGSSNSSVGIVDEGRASPVKAIGFGSGAELFKFWSSMDNSVGCGSTLGK